MQWLVTGRKNFNRAQCLFPLHSKIGSIGMSGAETSHSQRQKVAAEE
jgi:hypothetical protein